MRRACAAVTLLFAAAAHAQLGASAQLMSDYRFRGVSLSSGKPDLRLGLSYDDPTGWFGGLSATGVELEPRRRRVEWLGYAGYAGRHAGGTGWEAGLTALHYAGASRHDYAELFAGLIGLRWNARVHYAPDYFGRGWRTAYAELNGGVALVPPLRWFGHAGVLLRLDRPLAPGTHRTRPDLRTGIAAGIGPWDLQLAWVAVRRNGAYADAASRSTWVASVSLAL